MDKEQELKIAELRKKVDIDSEHIQKVIDEIIQPYVEDLDKYVAFIKDILADGENPPTAQELDDFCMNLSVYIYYASGMQEQLGIKDDISRALHKEMYHAVRDSIEKGTVADKDSLAELASQQESLVASLYKRAYNTMKAKVLSAQELLASCKKVISRRMQEYEITHLQR